MAGEAITDLSDILNRVTGGNSGTPETIFFFKDQRVGAAAAATPIAGRWISLWEYNGQPSHGAVPPTSATVPDNTTDGGLKQADPGGGRKKWCLGAGFSGLVPGTLIVYDRLLHISGLSGTVTTAQTVGGTLTRYTSGAGNQIWAEIYTQIGATGTTITASYTDQAGNSGQTSQAVSFGATNNREAQRLIPIALASGDTGVQAVASVTVLATTGTAGNFGIVVAHPLLYIPMGNPGVGCIRDLISGLPGLQEIVTDACLSLAWVPNSTTIPNLIGSIHFIEK